MRLRQFPIGATPRLQLAHRHSDAVYILHPITTPRPEAGTVDAVTTCATCGVDVPLRLSSVSWVRSRRRRQLLIGVTVMLVQLSAGALLVGLDHRLGWGGLPALAGFVTLLVTVFTAGPPLRESREADGVAGQDPEHTLREPGDTVDFVDHDGGNFEAGI